MQQGRKGNYNDLKSEDIPENNKEVKNNTQAERIINLLGGRENVVLVDACMTRLRITVKASIALTE